MEVTEKLEHDKKVLDVRRAIRFGNRTDELEKELERLEKVRYDYLREGGSWNRYAVYPNGKIHEEVYGCTGKISRNSNWLVNLSGSTVAEVIERHGARVCSRCFREAPKS
jgi:hypothetical protein